MSQLSLNASGIIATAARSAAFSATSDECVFAPSYPNRRPRQLQANVLRESLFLRRCVRRASKATRHRFPSAVLLIRKRDTIPVANLQYPQLERSRRSLDPQKHAPQFYSSSTARFCRPSVLRSPGDQMTNLGLGETQRIDRDRSASRRPWFEYMYPKPGMAEI